MCTVVVVREETRRLHDWVDLCLPLGSLARADERVGGYPFVADGTSLAWRAPVDEWLLGIAARLHDAVGFASALVGFEVSGDDAADHPEVDPPAERWLAYAFPRPGGLRVFPANR